jgi:hypothetical protein
LPRLESIAPFFLFIVLHLEWPDMFFLLDGFSIPQLVIPQHSSQVRNAYH